MRRAWRWLWRMFRLVALGSVLFCCGAARLPAPAFAAPPAGMALSSPGGDADSAPTPQERARMHRRSRQSRMIFLGSLLYEDALVTALLLAGGTRWLARLTARFGGRWIPALALTAGLVSLAGALLTLPLDYYAGFIFPHQYGLSNQTPPQWLHDYLLEQGVGVIFGFPLLLLGYTLLRRAPRTWWLWLAGLSVPVSIFFMLIQPVFVAPLFNTFTPLQNTALREEILTLARAQGIHASDVYQMDASRRSNAINAYVNGFGPTMRIVLYDTLLKKFTPAEIKFIMAHEMGHYVLGHIYQGIAFSVLGTLVAGFALYRVSLAVLARFGGTLGVTSLGDPAGYPLLIALGMAISLVALPIGNAFSRHLEWQADHFAARIDPDHAAGVAAFHKLARYNVSEETPPRWAEVLLGSHPSIAHRIAALEGTCSDMK